MREQENRSNSSSVHILKIFRLLWRKLEYYKVRTRVHSKTYDFGPLKPSMYFPNADKAQHTICSSPGQKRKWFLMSSRSTHNFIARLYSCISKVTTVIDSLPITWVVMSRALMRPVYSVSYSVGGSGSREEQDQHWSCHKTTIAMNWRLPTFLEHSA